MGSPLLDILLVLRKGGDFCVNQPMPWYIGLLDSVSQCKLLTQQKPILAGYGL